MHGMLRRALCAITLMVLCCARYATASAAEPPSNPVTDARLLEAQKACDEGRALTEALKYPEAIPLFERALKLREESVGPKHPDVAEVLNLLGETLRRLHEYQRAEPLLERGLAIREEVLGKDHPDVAKSLRNLAFLYQNRGLYQRAETLLQRALALWEKTYSHEPLKIAILLKDLGELYEDEGRNSEAERLYLRALALRETALGKDHPAVAAMVVKLGDMSAAQGRYSEAESRYQEALKVQTKVFGEGHLVVAATLHNLAVLYSAQGHYPEAEKLYQQVLEIRTTILGETHPEVDDVINNLVAVYLAEGRLAEAEPLLLKTLADQEKVLGRTHPNLLQPLANLARLYTTQGVYSKAREIYGRAIQIGEQTPGKNPSEIATLVEDLAILEYSQKHSAEAERLLDRALDLREKNSGTHHPDTARTLANLAILYEERGDATRAESAFLRALSIQESTLGKSHPVLANTLNSLGVFYHRQGRLAKAEALLVRAIALREGLFAPSHPDLINSLTNLAYVRLAQKRLPQALDLLERAFTGTETNLRQEILGFSETRLSSILGLLHENEAFLYSLVREYPDNARVRRLALSAALLHKGRSVEEATDTYGVISRSLDPADRLSLDRLQSLRGQLAALALQGADPRHREQYPQQLAELTAQADALEMDLAQRSAPLRKMKALPLPGDVVESVAKALAGDSALVEFVAYPDEPLLPVPGVPPPKGTGPLHYLALMLFPDGHTAAVDLGPAAPIDEAALQLQDALASRNAAYLPFVQRLHPLAFKPLQPVLKNVKHLYLATDGHLGLVPFEVFHDGQKFLVDDFEFTYLTSGKELLRNPGAPSPSTSVVVFADPDFGSPPVTSPPAPSTPSQTDPFSSVENLRQYLRAGGPNPWVPLPGTRKEAEAIQHLLPQAQLFLGREATKERLLLLNSPGILHIATHGFTLGKAVSSPETRNVGKTGLPGGPELRSHSEDPLLRTGLVLSSHRALQSQQASSPQPEDSLVTALELSGLDLWGTQLVVLSACDTGRGVVKLGEGVYGLRRSFVIAGAETLVLSLWEVNDATTQTLMAQYYENLLAGKGRTSALRQAMLSLRKTHPHPHYWAPFIAVGHDGALRGMETTTPAAAGASNPKTPSP